jgi:hypothetical protein
LRHRCELADRRLWQPIRKHRADLSPDVRFW